MHKEVPCTTSMQFFLRGGRLGLKPDHLTADSAYGSAESLAWLIKQKKITPRIPVFNTSTREDGTFSRADFTFDAEGDRYTCTAGKELVQFRRAYATSRTGITAEGTRLYRASKKDCDVCELKARCCRSPAGFHVICTKMPATSPGLSSRQRNTRLLVAAGKRLRCCLLISSASFGLGACGCGGHAAPRTNSSSQRPCRICDGPRD